MLFSQILTFNFPSLNM